MNEQFKSALAKTGNADLVTIEITVLTMAVKALIATHPDPSLVRRAFDQFYGALQASPAMMETDSDIGILARQLAEGFFPPEK